MKLASRVWIITAVLVCTLLLLQLMNISPLVGIRNVFSANENYIVSTSGDDNNPGTLAAPWRTVQKAFDMRAAGSIPVGSVIGVRAGIYREPVYSGADDLVVQGYNGEKWTVDLSMDINSTWTHIGNNVYRTTFTRAANWKGLTYPGVARVSTRVNTAAGPNERLAYLYVDDTVVSTNWLKPQFDGLDYTGPTNLPVGAFATDAPDPSGGADYGGMTSTLWVHLSDNTNPANHRIRVGKYAQAFYLEGANDITIRNMKLMLVEGNGFYGNADDLIIENNEFALMKNQPMTLWRGSSGHIIRNNWFHDLEYEAIHNESNSSLFENNTMENTLGQWSNFGPVGILTNGNDNTIRGNTVRNFKKSQSGKSGFGFFTEQWYAYGDGLPSGTGNIYENNFIDNNQGGGIWTSGGDNEIIRNNVVVNNGGPGIVVVVSSGPGGGNTVATNDVVYYNTVYNNGWGEDWGSGIHLQGSAGAIVRNNIVYANRTNYFQQGDTGTTISNNTTTNPLFINPSAGDFSIPSNSPAVGAAANVGILVDYRGVVRPQGGTYDTGAYEYTGTPPTSPTPTAIPPTATVVPTPTPGGPTPTATAVPQGLVISTPLSISATNVSWGQTLTASVTYMNTSASTIAVSKFIIGGRPPGGTNSNGPFLDFTPESGLINITAGNSYTFNAVRTFNSPDPIGTWYAFSTWFGADGVGHDAPANYNKSFTVSEVPVVATPTVFVSTPLNTIRITDDFLTGSDKDQGAVGNGGWGLTNPTTNAVIDGEANHPGVYQLATGTITNTSSALFTSPLVTKRPIAAADMFTLNTIVRPSASGTVRIGLTSDPLTQTPVEAAYFERLSTDTNWFIVSRHGSTQTRTDTGIASTTSWVNLTTRRVTSTSIGFSINNGTEQILTTNLPTGSLHAFLGVVNASAVNRTLDIDFIDLTIIVSR